MRLFSLGLTLNCVLELKVSCNNVDLHPVFFHANALFLITFQLCVEDTRLVMYDSMYCRSLRLQSACLVS